jgi:hypothetical protein
LTTLRFLELFEFKIFKLECPLALRAKGPPPSSGHPPLPPLLLSIEVAGRSLGDADDNACLYPRNGEQVGALPVPGAGAPRAQWYDVIGWWWCGGVARWLARRGAMLLWGLSATVWPDLSNPGLRSACAGRALRFVMIP